MRRSTIWYGGRNDKVDVRSCQQILNDHGFYSGRLDGYFGFQTHAAVKQFQGSANLVADGVVGPATWKALGELAEGGVEIPDTKSDKETLLFNIPFSVGGVRRRVLVEAIAFLGAREEPLGANRGPAIDVLVRGYNDYWQIRSSRSLAWCGMACSSWIAFGYGLKPNPSWGDWRGHPFYSFRSRGAAWLGGVSQMESWARSNQCWTPNSSLAGTWPAGGLFTVSRSGSGSDASSSTRAGHVGMIVCDNGDTITTIEGNVSDAVKSYTRKKSGLRGFITSW